MTALRPLDSYDGFVFDLDGVLTPTAIVHEHAWGALFRAYFTEHHVTPEYTDADYYAHLDGRPRYDAVASLLESRGIQLPWGSPEDTPEMDTVCGLGNRKNVVFADTLKRDGVTPYPGSVALLDWLGAHGVRVAVASSSRNARPVLAAAGLDNRFSTVVDGVVSAREHLAGKPAPDIFVRAAQLEGMDPARSVVVEDAISGVAAGHNGGFTVVGVDRGAGAEALSAAGADVVVSDLAELLS